MSKFDLNALTVLQKRYLMEGETPDDMLERVSFGNPGYYRMMRDLEFLPNSPTLFNAGTGRGTLSACFKFDVPDDMIGIMDVAKKAALVQKWGGGVGYVLSEVRGKGAPVLGTGNTAGGPVGFIRMFNSLGEVVTQSGKREAAQMAIISCDHPDVEEFITMKAVNPDALRTFNVSVALTDKFMEEVMVGGTQAEKLLGLMAEVAWTTGDPGCYFIDAAERDNPTPWLGKLTGTNPCGEIPLLDNEACNLGSINLSKFADDGRVKFTELQSTVATAIQFLDDILEHNQFPHEDITKAVGLTRKLGLGVMGWADMLAQLRIPYDSQTALDLAGKVMSTVQKVADSTSASLARVRGPAPAYTEGIGTPYRNVCRTAIAPTGSISLLAGCSAGIEPHFSDSWVRTMGDGTQLHEQINPTLKFSEFRPKTAHDIDWKWHLEHQATFQKYVDQSVSKTINMPNAATVDDVLNSYKRAWARGCKGVTIFRDGCREKQVLRAKVDESISACDHSESIPDGSCVVCPDCGGGCS